MLVCRCVLSTPQVLVYETLEPSKHRQFQQRLLQLFVSEGQKVLVFCRQGLPPHSVAKHLAAVMGPSYKVGGAHTRWCCCTPASAAWDWVTRPALRLSCFPCWTTKRGPFIQCNNHAHCLGIVICALCVD
jgi:hypothetical protein